MFVFPLNVSKISLKMLASFYSTSTSILFFGKETERDKSHLSTRIWFNEMTYFVVRTYVFMLHCTSVISCKDKILKKKLLGRRLRVLAKNSWWFFQHNSSRKFKITFVRSSKYTCVSSFEIWSLWAVRECSVFTPNILSSVIENHQSRIFQKRTRQREKINCKIMCCDLVCVCVCVWCDDYRRRDGYGDSSSKPGRGCLHFTQR